MIVDALSLTLSHTLLPEHDDFGSPYTHTHTHTVCVCVTCVCVCVHTQAYIRIYTHKYIYTYRSMLAENNDFGASSQPGAAQNSAES